MADDDLFGFFNELKEVKPPPEEEEAGGGGKGGGEQQHIGPASPPGATGKRAREEDEGEEDTHEIGPAMPPAHHPVFKKAKAVAAKPLLYDPPSIGPAEPPPQYHHQQQQVFAPPTSVSAGPTKAMPAYDEQPPPSSSSSFSSFPPSAPAPYQPYMAPYPGAAAAAAAPPPQMTGAGVGTLFTVGAGAKPAVAGGGGGGGGTGQQPAYGAAIAAAQVAAGGKPKKFIRVGPGETWEDPTLIEWPENDFRLFCGDLGPEVNDELLANAFKGKYPSFAKAKVLREKQTGKSRGYGFVSFLDPFEGLKALREMNGKYIGSRPVKLKKSDWKERDLKEVRKKEKAKKKFLGKLGLG